MGMPYSISIYLLALDLDLAFAFAGINTDRIGHRWVIDPEGFLRDRPRRCEIDAS